MSRCQSPSDVVIEFSLAGQRRQLRCSPLLLGVAAWGFNFIQQWFAARVVGIEAYAPAVSDAAINLDEFENVEIYEAPAEDVLPGLDIHIDAAVLDPPRAGCAPEVVETCHRRFASG